MEFNSNSTYVDLINSKYNIDNTTTDKLILKDRFIALRKTGGNNE